MAKKNDKQKQAESEIKKAGGLKIGGKAPQSGVTPAFNMSKAVKNAAKKKKK